ncbi:MAG: hypothetical protein IPJ65_12750 [Archangiaceae bacterium]|nr:hypothetical protein [Archangiaceae bacterium]
MTQRTQHTSEDVSVAELELTRQEEALEAEVTRLKVMRKETAEQLSRAKTQAEDPALFAALGRLEVPSVSIKAFTDEAQLARMKALGVRKLSVERSRAALKDYEMELLTLAERMRDEDQGARQRAVQKSAELEALAAAKKKAQAEAAASEEEDSLAATMLRAIAQPDQGPSAPTEVPLAPQTPAPTVQAAPRAPPSAASTPAPRSAPRSPWAPTRTSSPASPTTSPRAACSWPP